MNISGTNQNELVDAINGTAIQHLEISFPIQHLGRGIFQTANAVKFDFDFLGIDYTAYRTGGDKKRYSVLHSADRWDDLAAEINQDWNDLEVKPKHLIAAIYNGSLVGLMTKYNPVTHEQIVDAIDTAGLSKDIGYFYINEMVMRIYLAVYVGERFVVSLKITNGHSGHVSFGYMASFKTGSYEFDIPLIDRTRHLGTVAAALGNLKELIDAAGELKITEKLRLTTMEQVHAIIDAELGEPSKRMSTILSNMEHTSTDNALEFVVEVGKYTETRGYKKSASTIIAKVMEAVLV